MNRVINNKRFFNFELLRIFAMFLIVLSHFNVHGIYPYWHKNLSVTDYFNNLISSFFCTGQIGVTLFILITGYFASKQNFKLKKCLDIYLKTLFFSILIFICCFFIDYEQSIKALKYSIFPLTHNAYWFVTTYLLLYVFSPALNLILKKSSPETIKNYLILGAILWIGLPMFGLNQIDSYSNLIYFMYLYFLGGAIKLKYITISSKYLFFLFFCIFVFVATAIISTIFFWKNPINLYMFYDYFKLNSAYTLLISLGIFYYFKNLKINSPLVNWLSSSMFGVYLLHDNNLIRPYLWHVLLKADIAMNSPFFGVLAIFISICVFCLCIVLDKILSLIYLPLIEYIEKGLAKLKILKNYF